MMPCTLQTAHEQNQIFKLTEAFYNCVKYEMLHLLSIHIKATPSLDGKHNTPAHGHLNAGHI
jgi:hypothetical protein